MKKSRQMWAIAPVERLLQRSAARRAKGETEHARRAAALERGRDRRRERRVAQERPALFGPVGGGSTDGVRVVASTHAIGARAEDVAARWLERAGFEIVERNYRCEVGELDLIVRRGELLVFVEVRSRATDAHGEAAEMVIGAKRRQVSHVAAAYLANEQPVFRYVRFDVVAVTGGEIIWLPDAWRIGDRPLLATR